MASETLIRTALKLAKQLGANTSKFMGTKSNVSFLGSGPKDGMLFQQSINPESFASIGIKKVLPDIETSMSYLTGGKLNDIQTNKLIENMSVMLDVMDPLAAKNVVDASSRFGGGLGSLEGLGLKNLDNVRAKSGLGERQLTEAASDVKSIDDAAAGVNAADAADVSPLMSRLDNTVNDLRVAADDLPPPGSRGGSDDIAAPVMNYGDEGAEGIMQTIDKVDLPQKTGSAREFLFNALKKENPNQTTFADIVDPVDAKLILEGGGGVDGDPIVLVQKYFGPRIAEMLPVNASSEEMVIFTNRVLNNVVDAKGAKPTDATFDSFTARFVEDLADGGIAGLETRQGLKFGGKAAKAILAKIDDKMIKKAADDIFPTDDYKYDAEMVVEALVENNPKLFKNLLADDLDDALRSELYGLAVGETGNRAAMKMMTRRDAVKRGVVNEVPEPFKRESMKLVDGVTGKGEKFKTFETTTPPRMFQLNVEKAVSELNIPRAEAIRISQLPSDQQKLALQKYLDKDFSQRITLGDYNPKTFDAAQGGLAKILEV